MRDLGIETTFEALPFYRCDFFGPDSRRRRFETGEPFFYLVRRGGGPGSIEAGLRQQALDLGARIELGSSVDSLLEGGIVATGPKSADAIAVGVLFETDAPDQAAAIIDDELAPGGYAYRLVHDGHGTLATCLFRDFHREQECLDRVRADFERLAPIRTEVVREFGGFVNFFYREPVQRGDRLYVGEAAGLQDSLWGFGMRLAMLSGALAAKSILTGAEYGALFEQSLRPQMRASLFNRYLFDRLGNSGYVSYLSRMQGSGRLREYLTRMYQPNLLKSALSRCAERRYQSRLLDHRCGHLESCPCVWCRHGRVGAPATAL